MSQSTISTSTSHDSIAARAMSRQKRAFICVVIAWLVGTFVFEAIAVRGEQIPSKPAADPALVAKPESTGWLVERTMRKYETTKAVAMTELRGLVSVSENSEIVARLQEAITTETSAVVTLHRPKARIKKVEQTQTDERFVGDIKPDGLNVDPIVGVMPVATWVTRMAYRQLSRSRKPLGLHELTRHRIALDKARESAIPGLMRLAVDQRASQLLVMANYKQKQYLQTKVSPASIRKGKSNSDRKGQREKQELNSAQVDSELVDTARFVQDEEAIRKVRPVSGASQIAQNQSGYNQAIEAASDLVPTVAEPVVPVQMTPETVAAAPSITVASQPAVAAEPVVVAPQPVVVTKPVAPQPAVVASKPKPSIEAPVRHATAPPQKTVLQQPVVGIEVAKPNPSVAIASKPEARIAQWPFAKPQMSSNAPNVSLNVENTDVRSVLEMLARGYGMNILVSPDVEGAVTANVEGLTPDQTLQGVMKMCNLRAQVDQGVIYVYPAAKMPEDARVVRHFPLDFARAETIEPALQGLLSPIGNAYINKLDAEDNLKTREAIVVIDTLDSLRRIEDYIMQVDQAPRQVMIEARVLEIELTDDMQHGVNFDSVLRGDLTVGGFGLADGLASTTNPLFFAQIDGSRIQALIDLLETTTDAKTLATPKVMVVNGQHARIQVGQQLGFTVATVTQTSTIQDVQFLETGVVLSVTPTISRDGKIMMEVKPEVSNGQINPSTLLPEEETRELETSVLLNNHQGVVIGGLIQENDRTVIRKLPWLGDVKHVGKLFQRREEVRSRSEIVIALIPHIIEVDDHHQRDLHDEERWHMDYQRTQGPLLHGPLKRSCRPWEPRLPDVYRDSSHLDVNRVNQMIP